jgi:hypothetical protein
MEGVLSARDVWCQKIFLKGGLPADQSVGHATLAELLQALVRVLVVLLLGINDT